MTKEKEVGYKLGDVMWHNLEGYQELWNKASFDVKEKIINEIGRLAFELTKKNNAIDYNDLSDGFKNIVKDIDDSI